ncbi:hypothetical protein FUT87_07465 [Mitsuaria sp. TWR114]|uniref:hypothetical protein n=1 Tax=Mitsuaria sp. TWR114 TaxID=2601731 RepID=UPI0011C30E22|nr:hypothetical protein [Mitsuaria sp. TWR114]TXD94240.1 hypothetical protein FUT87_07465 [Mitsuaria sp. TWR114]
MPIFTRRRLQAMLDDLARRGDAQKLTDVRARLENKRVDQALPAEMELAVVWALARLGEIETEPEWFGDRRPDIYTEQLFPGQPCVVEVTAVSDGRMAQEPELARVGTKLKEAANRIRRGRGKHLSFQIHVEQGYEGSAYFRRRKVDADFEPSAGTVDLLRGWLMQDGVREPLVLLQGATHVTVQWHEVPRHPHSNVFCSMPAEAYSLEDNPLFDALDEKRRQLASPEFTGVRCIVVADAGSTLIRRLDAVFGMQRSVTGRQVIEYFLRSSDVGVDVVLTLSPFRDTGLWFTGSRRSEWRSSLFLRPGLRLDTAVAQRLASCLPVPRFEGYQARSLHQQALYRHDSRGWYLGTGMQSRGSSMTVKLSSRAVLELLAGRMTLERFHEVTGLKQTPTSANIFDHRLKQGDILSQVTIESGGLDKDDDLLVFELSRDPSAAPLRVDATLGTPGAPPSAGE